MDFVTGAVTIGHLCMMSILIGGKTASLGRNKLVCSRLVIWISYGILRDGRCKHSKIAYYASGRCKSMNDSRDHSRRQRTCEMEKKYTKIWVVYRYVSLHWLQSPYQLNSGPSGNGMLCWIDLCNKICIFMSYLWLGYENVHWSVSPSQNSELGLLVPVLID